MKTFKCDTCGDIDHVLLDGYPVGDRLLEGVMFEIRFKKNGKGYTATVVSESAAYMAGLNAKHWCKAMADYAKNADIATCPKCDGDVDVAPLVPVKPVVPVVAKMTSLPAMLRGLIQP